MQLLEVGQEYALGRAPPQRLGREPHYLQAASRQEMQGDKLCMSSTLMTGSDIHGVTYLT